MKNFKIYIKKVLEEFQKIKFPQKKEVVSLSVAVFGVILVCGLFFYLVDLLSVVVINKGIMNL